jgi:STE24 endopeptidase
MNGYALVILVAVLAAFALETAARLLDLRDLRRADRPLPREVRGVYDPAAYERARAYAAARVLVRLAESTFGLVALLLFWLAGGFRWLDDLVRGLGLPSVPTGLLYIGSLALASVLLSLPWRAWSTFVIEERFGFNRTTPRTFALDTVKGLALGILLGAPVLALVLLFFERAGSTAWIWCWAATSAFALAVQVVYPTWILPWWNRFEPLPEGELRSAILRYAERVEFPLAGVWVVDGSRRSAKTNAFFTGLGRRRRIALFDTLIDRHPLPELIAVLAHEVGHYKRRHVPLMIVLSILHSGILFYLLSLFLVEPELHRAFAVERPSIATGLVFFGLLYTPVELALSIAINALSRRHEYQADQFAASTTGDATSMIRALERLAVDNLSNPTPHPLVVALEASHPPVVQRIRALESAFPAGR